ncbi:hypothetical protein BDW71DRAFT_191763 [Aspergillus fruticulosus]
MVRRRLDRQQSWVRAPNEVGTITSPKLRVDASLTVSPRPCALWIQKNGPECRPNIVLLITEGLDAQVQWVENFPPFVQFNRGKTADDLSYFLHARYLDLRDRKWRQFLYLAARSSPQNPNLPSTPSMPANAWISSSITYSIAPSSIVTVDFGL